LAKKSNYPEGNTRRAWQADDRCKMIVQNIHPIELRLVVTPQNYDDHGSPEYGNSRDDKHHRSPKGRSLSQRSARLFLRRFGYLLHP